MIAQVGICLLLVSATFAAVMPGQEEEDKYGIFDKVKKIVSGASLSCNNKYISGPYLESVLCGTLVPAEYTQKLGITFGPETPWCAALACAYRAMGCPDPTYRIEAAIIKATGKHEDCAVRVGLDPEHCETLAKFIAKVPMAQPQNKKRHAVEAAIEEGRTPTFEDMSAGEREEAMQIAAAALRAYYPAADLVGLDDVVPPAKKRAGIIEELQVCSPLIATGLMLIEGQFNLPINVSDHLGPCGTVCNYAVCGLNILCASTAKLMIEKVNADRKFSGVPADKCPQLSCASFIEAPPNMCEGVQCPVPDGHYTAQNCPAPMQVYTPQKTSMDDCCTRCDNPCGGVNCPPLNCPPPQWPSCKGVRVGKYDQYDCCNQCVDSCAALRGMCPPAPQSCSGDAIIGPSNPNDCCVSCQPKCAGMDCTGQETQQSCQNKGLAYVPPKGNEATNCQECCGQCEQATETPTDATTAVASAAAAAAGVAAAML